MEISGNVAVVTGGASGLGGACAEMLTAGGAKVAIFDLNAEAGEAKARELGGAFFKVDVSDEASVIAGLDAAAEQLGAARILVNCAGIGPAARTVGRENVPAGIGLFSTVIKVNLIGTYNMITQFAARAAALDPIEGERGVIVNTASVAAFDGQIGQSAYAASKGGIVGMTLPIARDLAGLGIRVATIAPGIFRTPLLASLPEEVQDSLGKQVPFPSRLGDPSEFADLVRTVATNRYLNGEVIRLDGAIRMAPR